MRIANLIMCALFSFSALLQLNDPDPGRWIAIYAAAAAMCAWLGTTRGRNTATWLLPGLVAGSALIWAAAIAYHSSAHVHVGQLFEAWEMRNEAVEEDREMYGLLIVGAWMLVAALSVRWRRG